ncbi:MAG: ImmA/IrrE family metallo-endopeptidase [Blastocatellia bacterium]
MALNGADSKYLPPPAVGRWRAYERSALQIRRFVGLGIHERLDPYALTALLGLQVLKLDDLKYLPAATRNLVANADAWSGAAISTGDSHIVLINSTQSLNRQTATLMEEVCHILLGHRPSIVSHLALGGRDYDHFKEDEAYAVGAAALTPYFLLKSSLAAKEDPRALARRLGVSLALLTYRVKGLCLSSLFT